MNIDLLYGTPTPPMTTIDFTKIAEEYKNWTETTLLGREVKQVGERMRGEWGGRCVEVVNMVTKFVRKEYLPDMVQEKVKKVTITDIGENNCCHQNSVWVQETFGLSRVFGFNITACKCGGRMMFEPHSLNIAPDGSYFDITTDFCGEKEKWFYPIENPDFTPVQFSAMYNSDYFAYEPACRCGKQGHFKWDNSPYNFVNTETEMEEILAVFETY